ncbi:hypothetical protein D8T45_00220 [Vibrio vulnificus]|nr:hypothetical protein D8T45_00220 [Vibrio vulnificus]RZR20106.1 hypothetical protein D8T24_02380 [Vibrio vulnificus]
MRNINQSKRWRNLQTVCKFYQLFPTHFCIGDAHKVFYLLIHMLMIFLWCYLKRRGCCHFVLTVKRKA